MSLTQALAAAVSGLHANQSAMSLIAANVSNAETPGYVKKTAVQITTAAGDLGIGVRVAAVNRELDQYVQRQLRVQTSASGYADLRSQFYDRLQRVFGTPGADGTLESAYNNFTAALQALSTSPDASANRSAVLSAAQVVTQSLNSMTQAVQGLRSDAELGLSDSVANANNAMLRIAQINQQLGASNGSDGTTAVLEDQRDVYIDQLAQLMDITVVKTDHDQVNVFTTSGIQLVGVQASHLNFDAQGTMTATAQWTNDPTTRTVGTITLSAPNGGDVDLIANKAFRSGQIATYLEMRDQLLPQAQNQLDQIAAALSTALSNKTVDADTATSGAQAGFSADLSKLQSGNVIHLSYTSTATAATKSISIVRVDDPGALPLSDSATIDPNDKVIGVDFSGGMASVVSQLNTALGPAGLTFSNSGNTLQVLDDGAANTVTVNSMSVTYTVNSLTDGTSELPFFTDANSPYTGAITQAGTQTLGYAGRITVNGALLADPSRLVISNTSPLTDSADATRPNFILSQLTSTTLSFDPNSGIGSTGAPFAGSLPTYLQQVLSAQGEAADAATNLKAGQDVVLSSLQQRFNEASSVNIDEEMANLLNLQNAYAANARVMSTIKEMLQSLMQL